jgi:penicillin-binding protein 1A
MKETLFRFVTIIANIFSNIWTPIEKGLSWIARITRHVLYSILAKILGETRMQAIQTRWQQFKQPFLDWYDSKVDSTSPYYDVVIRMWKIFFKTTIAFIFFICCLQTNFLYLTGEMPSVEELQNPKLSQSSEMYYSDGKTLLGKFFTENRTPVKDFKQLSPHLVNALVATEDARFYQHSGIDYQALFGVAVGIVTSGGERGGGSTITQQLAKNLFKTRLKKGFAKTGVLGYIPVVRKIVYKLKEWLTAIQLERHYTKDEIALMYLNTVDYGSNSYGIKVAARTYFNTSPDSLNIQEAAVLVGLQKATTTYNPMLNLEKSTQRRNTVLNQMAKYKFLTKAQADSVSALPLVLDINVEQPVAGYEGYFKKAINDQLQKWAKDNEIELDLYRDGLRIVTTIDVQMQEYAQQAVSEGMKQLQRTFDNHWAGRNPWCYEDGTEIPNFIDSAAIRTEYYQKLKQRFPNSTDSIWQYMNKPHRMKVFSWKNVNGEVKVMSSLDSIHYYKKLLQAGMMTIDPFNGHIKAWVGGLDFAYFKYDHVKQAKRQPGSTFKPFLYCTAIDGPANMSPCDHIKDEPFEVEVEEKGEKKVWAPHNADGRFSYNNYTLRQAMAKSVNACAARLTDRVGADSVVYYAHKLGITSKLQAVPSIALGPFDVSLFEMISAYSPFANGGLKTEPILVWKIEDSNGHVLHEFTQKPDREQVISEESAFLMRWMLQGGMQERGGTSQNLWSFPDLFPNYSAEYGGKTGTTSNHSDGWFMGVSPDLITGVWVGGDDRSIHFRTGEYGEGSKTALPIYGRFMTKVFNDKALGYSPHAFPKPTFKILKEYQCTGTGGGGRPISGGESNGDTVIYTPIEEPNPSTIPDTTGGN